MLIFYGPSPPASLDILNVGGVCPHCKKGTRYGQATAPISKRLREDGSGEFVISYCCEICLKAIPVLWDVIGWQDAHKPVVANARVVLAQIEEYDFDHVPDLVRTEIAESLACLSVGAFNGFSAVCRRAVQAICTDLGASAKTKVRDQITSMLEMTGLGKEWEELAFQVMLSGHDGSHPHLPEVGRDRAAILLSLMQDLTYQLYTRPGKVKAAAALREEAIKAKR